LWRHQGIGVRTSTIVMIGFAVLFGLLAVFLAQTWINNEAAERMRSLEAQHKGPAASRTIVVASKAMRFGDELSSGAMREMPWPEDALPAGTFGKIADLTSAKRVVLQPIEPNEAILATKVTGPGQRATLSATLQDGMKAVTVRVNDVEGVAGFVLPGDRVDVLLTRQGEKNMADERTEKPSVVKAVTLEVNETDGQKIALAATTGTLSLLLRKAGELVDESTRRVTSADLGRPSVPQPDARFVTVGVIRPSGQEQAKRFEYTVPVEGGGARSAVLSEQEPARN
jgi:pilus assembly protein CpaB